VNSSDGVSARPATKKSALRRTNREIHIPIETSATE